MHRWLYYFFILAIFGISPVYAGSDGANGTDKFYDSLANAQSACISAAQAAGHTCIGYSPSSDHPGYNYYKRIGAGNYHASNYYFLAGGGCASGTVPGPGGQCIEDTSCNAGDTVYVQESSRKLFTGGAGNNASINSCEYTPTPDQLFECDIDGEIVPCTEWTATGDPLEGAPPNNTDPLVTTTDENADPEPTNSGGCQKGSDGIEICYDEPECDVTVNGSCAEPVPNEPECSFVNGGKICSNDPTNCTYSTSGQLVCASNSTNPPTNTTCIDFAGDVRCFDRTKTQQTDTNTTTNPNGSTTTTETTTTNAQGDPTTTTTTTTNTDGSQTSTTTTSGGTQSDLTQKEDGTEEEGTDSTYTDNGCSSPPSCEGDAIQCAIAKEAWKSNCNLEATPAYLASDSLLDGSSDNDIPVSNDGNPIDVSSMIDFDSHSLTSGGTSACPSPLQVSIMGSSIEFSYEPFCQLASILRPFLLVLSTFVAARITYNGVLQT